MRRKWGYLYSFFAQSTGSACHLQSVHLVSLLRYVHLSVTNDETPI